MQRNISIVVLIICLQTISACKKEKIDSTDCQKLQNGISTVNKEEVKIVINKFINSLPSQNYTEENMNNLASAIGQQCGASVAVLCFDCIKTLPSQTEIRISYFGIGGPIEKTIDITYTTNNKMIFRNLHH
ncbi:MAG: hypothetical protein ABR503_06215 [Chitinophagaceae bacterium]